MSEGTTGAGERRRERRWDKSGPAPVVLIMIMSTDIASALSVIDDM